MGGFVDRETRRRAPPASRESAYRRPQDGDDQDEEDVDRLADQDTSEDEGYQLRANTPVDYFVARAEEEDSADMDYDDDNDNDNDDSSSVEDSDYVPLPDKASTYYLLTSRSPRNPPWQCGHNININIICA